MKQKNNDSLNQLIWQHDCNKNHHSFFLSDEKQIVSSYYSFISYVYKIETKQNNVKAFKGRLFY
jgi:hypothetical protein